MGTGDPDRREDEVGALQGARQVRGGHDFRRVRQRGGQLGQDDIDDAQPYRVGVVETQFGDPLR